MFKTEIENHLLSIIDGIYDGKAIVKFKEVTIKEINEEFEAKKLKDDTQRIVFSMYPMNVQVLNMKTKVVDEMENNKGQETPKKVFRNAIKGEYFIGCMGLNDNSGQTDNEYNSMVGLIKTIMVLRSEMTRLTGKETKSLSGITYSGIDDIKIDQNYEISNYSMYSTKIAFGCNYEFENKVIDIGRIKTVAGSIKTEEIDGSIKF